MRDGVHIDTLEYSSLRRNNSSLENLFKILYITQLARLSYSESVSEPFAAIILCCLFSISGKARIDQQTSYWGSCPPLSSITMHNNHVLIVSWGLNQAYSSNSCTCLCTSQKEDLWEGRDGLPMGKIYIPHCTSLNYISGLTDYKLCGASDASPPGISLHRKVSFDRQSQSL